MVIDTHVHFSHNYDRADVTITDLPDFVELMYTNIDLNKESIQGSVIARALTWQVFSLELFSAYTCSLQ